MADNESSGFKSFWETSKRKAAYENVTFVQVEVEPQGESSKAKAQPKVENLNVESGQSEGSTGPEESGRRQQVYEAQKRHRRRKAEYSVSLEEEIARLKHADALMKSETWQLATENTIIRNYLASEGLSAGLHVDDTAFSWPTSLTQVPIISMTERAAGSGRFAHLGQSALTHLDPASQAEMARCRELLLRDLKDFNTDEEEEEKTWKSIVDLVLEES